jgi:hypothetical protein
VDSRKPTGPEEVKPLQQRDVNLIEIHLVTSDGTRFDVWADRAELRAIGDHQDDDVWCLFGVENQGKLFNLNVRRRDILYFLEEVEDKAEVKE